MLIILSSKNSCSSSISLYHIFPRIQTNINERRTNEKKRKENRKCNSLNFKRFVLKMHCIHPTNKYHISIQHLVYMHICNVYACRVPSKLILTMCFGFQSQKSGSLLFEPSQYNCTYGPSPFLCN